ncbi:MAG TPA: hypothetical protein DEO32_04340 [Ruminococcaceae bacterium]|nr:hypothetical protein [Oscillospiraceae bacterium]
MKKKLMVLIMAAIITASFTACSTGGSQSSASSSSAQSSDAETKVTNTNINDSSSKSESSGSSDEIFTSRDLEQTADTSNAKTYNLSDGENIKITEEGVYIIKGSAKNVTITVEAADDAKVQLVLDSASITNDSAPCIYVKNADKVFVTTADGSTNTLTVSGSFTADGDTNTDAVIFSKDDLVINGKGTLNISSSDNGVTSKDDLKITGGTINIECASDGLEVNDMLAIADGSITIKTSKDGVHADNSDDATQGSFYMKGGTLNVTAGDDGIHAITTVTIDGGTINASAAEGIEGTYIKINGGKITIEASDDGINAAQKSNNSTPTVEFNGGETAITMGQGDTDGVDSNGNIYINGGTISINAQSPFDYDGEAKKNGGTIIVNGTETDDITNQFGGMGGGMGGGMRGGQMRENIQGGMR